MDSELIRAIQLLALEAAESRTYEGFTRNVARWYSKTFSTPLEIVLYDIPFNNVLLAYYEETFANMIEAASGDLAKHREWEQFRARLLADPKDARAQEAAASDSDDEYLAQMLAQEIAKEASQVAKKIAESVEKPSQKPNIQPEPPDLTKVVKGEEEIPPQD